MTMNVMIEIIANVILKTSTLNADDVRSFICGISKNNIELLMGALDSEDELDELIDLMEREF